MVKEAKSYQINKLVVRSFLGKQHLSFPPIDSTIEDIDDLESVVTEDDTPPDEEEQQLAAVTVTGIQQLESLYTYINFKKTIHSSRSRVVCAIHAPSFDVPYNIYVIINVARNSLILIIAYLIALVFIHSVIIIIT